MSQSRRTFIASGLGATASAWSPARGEKQELTSLTLKKASELLRSRSVSPVELTQACLGRIQKLNRSINAFITVAADSALETARQMEAEARRGKWRGPLHGIPIALKDNIDTAGIQRCSCWHMRRSTRPNGTKDVQASSRSAGEGRSPFLSHAFRYNRII
ncbi:MAG TPA: amidase family protein [Bryobacteraceae bacterium]|nr:amidase family protein [Bryobacteraceae bacterium]